MVFLTSAGFGLDTLLQAATTVLQWFITSFGSILTFFTANTALLIWFLVAIAAAALIFFRKLF